MRRSPPPRNTGSDLLSRLLKHCRLPLLIAVVGCSEVAEPQQPHARVWIQQSEVQLVVGDTGTLTALFQQGGRAPIEKLGRAQWASSGEGVVRIDSLGKVEAVDRGMSTVWVAHEGARDSISVHVTTERASDKKWKAVSVGPYSTCALDAGGGAYCWGSDFAGVVGDGRLQRWSNAHSPVVVDHPAQFQNISVGRFHACGRASGEILCWGDGPNVYGNEREEPVLAPESIGPFAAIDIAAGLQHTCLLDEDGRARCWGQGAAGAGGDGDVSVHLIARPTPVAGDHRFVDLTAGDAFTCGLTTAGVALCWGSGFYNGGGTGHDQAVPEPVASPHHFEGLVGGGPVCGKSSDGYYCWGANRWYQIDDSGQTRLTPTKLADNRQMVLMLGASTAMCGGNPDGTYCWGSDATGNLGAGREASEVCSNVVDFPCSKNPQPISGNLVFVELSMSSSGSCGITGEGDLYCWGSNEFGQLGNGSLVSVSHSPVRVVVPPQD